MMWMDMIFCRKMMEKEENSWHLIRSSYSRINWNNCPNFLLALFTCWVWCHHFVPNRKQLCWFHDEKCSHCLHWSFMSLLLGKRKLLGRVVTGKTASSSAQPPTNANSFPSSSVSPSLGLKPFLTQVVWELQFTSFHYPEHSPPMPKPRSSDAYKSLISVFIKVFNLAFTVAS